MGRTFKDGVSQKTCQKDSLRLSRNEAGDEQGRVFCKVYPDFYCLKAV